MTKWEYKTVHIPVPHNFWATTLRFEKVEPELNRLGAKGWEVVSIKWLNRGIYAVCKKPV